MGLDLHRLRQAMAVGRVFTNDQNQQPPKHFTDLCLAILALPVPQYCEPPAVSGEIDTTTREPRIMSSKHDDIFNGLANAKPLASYGERIGLGRHVLILKEYTVRETSERGDIIAADFVVESSTGDHRPGTLLGCAWFISDKGWQGDREKSRAAEFVKALVGTDDPATAAKQANRLRSKDQPGMGIKIVCTGVRKKGEYIEPKFEHVPGQSGETIKAARAKLESTSAPAEERKAEPKPEPKTEAPAAPSGGSLLDLL